MRAMRPKILVVDDDERIAASVRRALIYEGYDVEVANDGEAVLARIIAGNWQLGHRPPAFDLGHLPTREETSRLVTGNW